MSNSVDGGQDATGPVATADELCLSLALNLGWQFEQLFRSVPRSYQPVQPLPGRLRGLSELTHCQRFERHLDEVHVTLARLVALTPWDDDIHAPTTANIRSSYARLVPSVEHDVAATRSSTEQSINAEDMGLPTAPISTQFAENAELVRVDVSELHEEVLIKLMGVSALVGTAYNLGRQLADICSPSQSLDDLRESFKPERLAQQNAWLTEMATILPSHAAKAVGTSLSWWRDVVYLDVLIAGQTKEVSAHLALSPAPGIASRRREHRGPLAKRAFRSAVAQQTIGPEVGSKVVDRYVGALSSQGEIWRALLAGERGALDTLTPDLYIEAARGTLSNLTRLAMRSARVLAVPVALLSVLTAGLVAIVLMQPASGGSKIAGLLGSSALYLLGIWRTTAPRLASLATRLERPLWGAQIDDAVATAITISPAGIADPNGWIKFVAQASDSVPPRSLLTQKAAQSLPLSSSK